MSGPERCELCGEKETVADPLADFVPAGTTPETFDPAERKLAHGDCGFDAGMEMA